MNCVPKSTSPCLETLLAIDGDIQHLVWHQARFEQTRKAYFDVCNPLSLSDVLEPPKEGTFRVRVVYEKEIQRVEYLPRVSKPIASLCLVESNIDYAYKYANREALNALIPSDMDDVLITCNDELRDISIANIALLIDGVWHTPLHPLLLGTTRQRLLASGFLKASSLTTTSLKKAEKFAIMNALIGFKIIDRLSIKGL